MGMGTLMSVWCLLSSYRILMGGIFLMLCLCLRKKGAFQLVLRHFVSWCNNHSSFAFAVSILLGLVVRLIVYLLSSWYGVDDLWTQAPDYKWIWNEAVQFSQGMMPPTKSWTSVWLYGSAFGLCGSSLWTAYILSTLLLAISSWCGYKILVQSNLPAGGVLFAFFFFNSPVMIMHSWCVATEQIFTLFMMLALLTATQLRSAMKNQYSARAMSL